MSRAFVAAVALLFIAGVAAAAGVPKEHIKEYGKGIIEDYSDMKEGEDIEWFWVASGVQLSSHRYEVKSVENLTVFEDNDMMEVFEETLPKTLKRAGARDESAPVLTADLAIYWAQRANRSKWFIPYAGFHLAQAGVGIEIVFKDKDGTIVAKMRHSGREGDQFEAAATELVDDVAQFIRSR